MFEQIQACLNGEITDKDVCDELYLNAGIMAEYEAINLYKTIASKSDNEKIRVVMQDIADEERVHIGEFKELLFMSKPKVKKLEDEGKKEVHDSEGDSDSFAMQCFNKGREAYSENIKP